MNKKLFVEPFYGVGPRGKESGHQLHGKNSAFQKWQAGWPYEILKHSIISLEKSCGGVGFKAGKNYGDGYGTEIIVH